VDEFWVDVREPAEREASFQSKETYETHEGRINYIRVHIVDAVGQRWHCYAFRTGFSYQGRLANGGNVATGYYDLKFSLFDG